MDARLLALGALTTLLLVGALRAFLSAIYFHNLTSLGLNATALYALLLLAPALYAFPLGRLGARRVALGAGLALGLARAGMGVSWGRGGYLPLSGLAAAAGLALLPALAVHARDQGRRGAFFVALGAGAGLAVDLALLLALRSHDELAGGAPGVALGVLGATAYVFLLRPAPTLARAADAHDRAAPPREVRAGALALAGVALGAWLFLEHAVLGSAFTLARWNGLAPRAVGLVLVVGLLAPLALAWRGARLERGALLGLNAVALVAVLDHALVHSPLLLAAAPFAQAALVLDLAVVLERLGRATLRGAGLATLAGALVALALHFAFAFSFTFAYVPLGGLWQHAERSLAPLAFALVLAGAAPRLRGPVTLPRARRALVAAALALPALLLAAALVTPGAPVPAAGAEGALRVASFNLHQGFNNDAVVDPDVFVEVLRELDADVVALQESDTARFTSANLDIVHHLAETLGYHVAYGPATREQSVGVSLLSRLPIEAARVHRLPTTTDNRFALEARLDAGGGRDLWVYATHFGLELPDRELQAEALLRLAEAHAPRVLVGDFNSCPERFCPEFEGREDDVYGRLTANHTDAWVAAGHGSTDPSGYTYDAAAPYERIDYLFVSQGVSVLAFDRVLSEAALGASDHLPIVADLRLPSALP